MTKISLKNINYVLTGKDGLNVGVEVGDGKIVLVNERGGENFIFDHSGDQKTLERWQEIIGLMDEAVRFLKRRTAAGDFKLCDCRKKSK